MTVVTGGIKARRVRMMVKELRWELARWDQKEKESDDE